MNKRAVYVIAFGIFVIVNAELGVIGILPQVSVQYATDMPRASWLISLFALVVAVCGPFMTLLCSNWNNKTVMLSTLGVFTLSGLLSTFAPTFGWLLLFRITAAFLHPVYFSIAFAATARFFPQGERARASAFIFVALSAAFVAGIPATTWIASKFSLEAAFLFTAALNGIALLGSALLLPSMPVREKQTFVDQIRVLRKPQLWLNIAGALLIVAGMFAVYSYIADFLQSAIELNTEQVSLALILFGMSGIAGNVLTGRLLSRNMTATTMLYPIVLAAVFTLLYVTRGMSLAGVLAVVLIWGAVHMSGLLIAQIWITSEATEAPVFSGSLYTSFANFGVAFGTAAGGRVLDEAGVAHIVWCGVALLAAGFGLVALKKRISRNR